jgi:hypothetical protein
MMESVKGIDWYAPIAGLSAAPSAQPLLSHAGDACEPHPSFVHSLLTHEMHVGSSDVAVCCTRRASMEDALPAFICMIFMPLTFKCAARNRETPKLARWQCTT